MRRFYFGQPIEPGTRVDLGAELAHHILDVCRFGVGDEIEVLDGQGNAFRCLIEMKGRGQVSVLPIEARQIEDLKSPYLHLKISVPKFATFENILEKSVELGVKSVQPFFSDFSFVKDPQKLGGTKWTRWEKIIRGATQQSGRARALHLLPPSSLRQVLSDWTNETTNQKSACQGLFAYEGGEGSALDQVLPKLGRAFEQDRPGLGRAFAQASPRLRSSDSQEIWVFVGSEGGFSRAEVELFKGAGLEPCSMGSQILRVETACVSLISVLKYHFRLW